MLTNELIAELSSEKLKSLLEQLDTQRVWVFSEEERSLITAMFYSDSYTAFGKASFIAGENGRNLEPLVSVLIDIASRKGERGRALLIQYLFTKDLVWRKEFSSCVIDSLSDVSALMRSTNIRLLLMKSSDVFSAVYSLATGKEFLGVQNAKQWLEGEYRKNSKKIVDVNNDNLTATYFDFFICKKRLIRSLLSVLIIQEESIQAARKIILDEDSLVFDDLEFRYRLANCHWK